MKNFNEYEEDLYKCSRCGLCQVVCPVYKATLNECAVSKGKFNMLNGIVKGELKFSSQIKKYLDLCTGCNACKNFCPSSIDARKIFLAAKSEYYNRCDISFFEKLFSSYFLFKSFLLFTRVFGCFYRGFCVHYVVNCFKPFLNNLGLFGRRILLADYLFFNKFFIKNNEIKNKNLKKVIFFEGCFNKFINPESKNALKFLLNNIGVKVITKNFDCCGISYLNDGNIKSFKCIVDKNLRKFGIDFDYVITDCASCNDVLKQYVDYSNDQNFEIANNLKEKSISILELLKNYSFSSKASVPLKIAIHKPCHECFDIEQFVSGIGGIEFVKVENQDSCCGFSGSFAIKNQEISREISKQKVLNYINSNVDFVLTTCPACLLGLEQGLLETNSNKKPLAMNLLVFLAKHCVIVEKNCC